MTLRPSRLTAAAAALALVLLGGPEPVRAQSEESEQSSPEELAREGAERLMQALEQILRVIPQYGMPRIEEDGDIVIPRLNPPGEEEQDRSEPEGEPSEDDDGEDETKQI